MRVFVLVQCFSAVFLTHVRRMEFPTLINYTSPIPFLGLSGGSFPFYSNMFLKAYPLEAKTAPKN